MVCVICYVFIDGLISFALMVFPACLLLTILLLFFPVLSLMLCLISDKAYYPIRLVLEPPLCKYIKRMSFFFFDCSFVLRMSPTGNCLGYSFHRYQFCRVWCHHGLCIDCFAYALYIPQTYLQESFQTLATFYKPLSHVRHNFCSYYHWRFGNAVSSLTRICKNLFYSIRVAYHELFGYGCIIHATVHSVKGYLSTISIPFSLATRSISGLLYKRIGCSPTHVVCDISPFLAHLRTVSADLPNIFATSSLVKNILSSFIFMLFINLCTC